VAAPWPLLDTVLQALTVLRQQLYLLGGFDTATGEGKGINQIWEFTPSPAPGYRKPTVLPVLLGYIPTTNHRTLIYTVAAAILRLVALTDRQLLVITRANTIGTIPPYRGRQERRGRLLLQQDVCLGCGQNRPNPQRSGHLQSVAIPGH